MSALVNGKAAAEHLGFSYGYFRKLISVGSDIPSYSFGGHPKYDLAELDAWKLQHRRNSARG